ncbi:hypothetical protein HTSR_1468 [Halodesulfurarchaeum formicicum]|uniref:DUF7310 domain-containing protein n=1 Tax=Halodesulfurarchaeum formicicum TaxID=1873524 RepID=A0A1D8S5L6_9EURY|nr:hypothetical protein [Halodesulfurarchaeum formicicum]AOW80644.1 hypothetical protein HTSR_1468 [Halodesulfurarchaeum formicicum]
MPARRSIDERLGALERRFDDREGPGAPTSADTDPAREESLEARIESLEETVTELRSEVQALRGYVGQVEHVNQSVERRADAAIAAVERLESAPKTPPPIATASPDPTTADADSGTETTESDPAEPAEPTAESGLLDRLRDLR